ncbi:MAG: MFS transporter [Nocardioidaceae bacterium]
MTHQPVVGPFDREYRRLSIGIFGLIVGIAFEFMAVATALPVAARELGGQSLFAFALTGFLGAVMFANGLGGEICDRIGPRVPLVIGALTFAGGLVVSGLSPTMPLLIVGRVVQGLGAGFTIVAVYVVIAQCYPDELRPRVMSLISTAWIVPSVVGPFIAGTLTEYVSWRWAFLSLVPLMPVPLLAVLPKLAASRATGTRRPHRVQYAAAMAAGAALMQWGGLQAEHSRWLLAIAAVGVGLSLLVASARQMFPAGTLRLRRGLPSVVAFRGVMAGGFFSTQAYVPLMMVEHRGLSPTIAGLSVAGTALGWSAGAIFQGRPALRMARSALVVRGAVVVTVGVLITASAAVVTSAVTVPAWFAGVGLLIGGVGMGLSMASNAVLLFDYSPVADRGANSAAIQMSDSLGGLTVIGAAGVVYAVWRDSWSGTEVFTVIFTLSSAVMLLAIFVATRVRRPT